MFEKGICISIVKSQDYVLKGWNALHRACLFISFLSFSVIYGVWFYEQEECKRFEQQLTRFVWRLLFNALPDDKIIDLSKLKVYLQMPNKKKLEWQKIVSYKVQNILQDY